MSKFTYDWLVQHSMDAQKQIADWPPAMKNNLVIATATLPGLNDDNQSRNTELNSNTVSESKEISN